MLIPELLGILGVVMVLGGYFLIVSSRLEETDSRYLGLNILGSVLILVSLAYRFNLAATVLQAAWTGITLLGILRRRWSRGLTNR